MSYVTYLFSNLICFVCWISRGDAFAFEEYTRPRRSSRVNLIFCIFLALLILLSDDLAPLLKTSKSAPVGEPAVSSGLHYGPRKYVTGFNNIEVFTPISAIRGARG